MGALSCIMLLHAGVLRVRMRKNLEKNLRFGKLVPSGVPWRLPTDVGILRRLKGRVKNRVKDFFEIPPRHDLKEGMLVTCNCHGGIGIVLELFDNGVTGYPRMNMAKIWWIVLPPGAKVRIWMHNISRLSEYDVLKS